MILAATLSLLVGVTLGMLGGGGSILTVPVLVYALGVEKRVAMAESLVVVALTSVVALVRPARAGQVVWKTGLLFATAGMLGSYTGGRISGYLPARGLLFGFAAMMLATAYAMIRGRREPTAPTELQPPKVLATGLLTGLLTGLVGAGGGFVIVPALALVGGLPMRQAIGTSLFVVALQSFTGFLGHASHVSIDVELVTVVASAASVGAVLGGTFGARVPQEKLRRGFGVFVLTMACYVIARELGGA